MKRFTLTTLRARIMLLIALLLGIGQFATLQLYEYFEREPRAAAAALQAVSVVNFTRASLLAAHENRRLALLSELSGKEGVHVYTVDLLEEVEPLPKDPMIQLVAKKIRNSLGPETLITINHFGVPGLWVSFSIDDEDFWVVIPRLNVQRPFPWQWLGWGIVGLMLSLSGAYFITSRINRPLKALVNAANQIKHGIQPEKLIEEGAEELRQVSHTFNEMTDALSRLDSERNLLFAGISHDLRTPLARLRLSVEMLPEEDSLKQGMIQDIEDMNGIIRQFLDYVRGIEGETPQMASLNELIKSVSDRYVRTGKNLTLNLQPLPDITIRPLAMQRLLANLIDNAFAYGGEKVEVHTELQTKKLVIKIFDYGKGIPESEMARLLRPFERIGKARGNDGGSGLGLAISDRISRLHQGELTLKNRAEGGLAALISLPLTAA